MIPLVKPFMAPPEELMPALQQILYSGYIAEGEAVYAFENKIRDYFGNPYMLALHSGTDGLHIALLLAGVKPGDEVISTAMTAEPTNTAIAMTGAKVVWGDVDSRTGLLSPEDVRKHITDKTKAIMLVHYAGMVCNMEAFNQLSAETGIPIIEDAAHALGSKFDGKFIGNNSPYTVFSLQAIKHMTTVDGGIIAVKNEADFDRARRLRWFGLDKKSSRLNNNIKEVGFKYAMNNVNATIGIVQMNHLNDILSIHKQNGKFFDKKLCNISGITTIPYYSKTEPSYWLYTCLVEQRDNFITALADRGVVASPLHLRNDRHDIFANAKRELAGLDHFYSRFVHLPCGWWVGDEERAKIVDAIKKGW